MALGDSLQNVLAQFRALPPGRQLVLLLAAAGSLAFFGWMATGVGRPDYRLLYRGLPPDEAASVVDALDQQNIPYRVEDEGSALYVPASHVHLARIRLAGSGLPGGGGPGLEIFDRPGFGVTDFVHQVNWQRALQGELTRSIEQLAAVERARVQLAIPERSVFVRTEQPRASASVVVKLAPGRDLEAEQVRAIVHLVASSVDSLEAGQVTLVDDRGRMLAPLGDGTPGPSAPGGNLQYQARLERELAQRVQTILEPTVGMGRVVAKVRADLLWTQTETTEERFDPDSQVARSEQRSTESSSEGAGANGGVPGVAANSPDLGGAGGVAGGESASSSRTSETVNYEISKTVVHQVEPVGEVERLHVAVLVDGAPTEDGAFQAWDAPSLQRFEELTKRAVGFSADRGDQISVQSAPFRSLTVEEDGGGGLSPDVWLLLSSLLHYGALFLAFVLFARLVFKPLLGAATSGGEAASLPMTAEQLEAQLALGQGSEAALSAAAAAGLSVPAPEPTLAEQVGAVAQERGEDSVRTLRNWLGEE